MNLSEVKSRLFETRSAWGDWTAHNIELAPDLYTIDDSVRGDEILVQRCTQIIADLTGRPFKELRILDLGCLEGLYSIELAKQGAQVVGLEIRKANLAKAQIAKEVLGLANLTFIEDDVRNLSPDKHGKFDVILCVGLLYHLDQPEVFKVIEKMYACCSNLLILDTHISLHRSCEVEYKNASYEGLYFAEHDSKTSLEQRKSMLWSSIDNEKSFWFTRPSLYNFLAKTGFSSVFECQNPAEPQKRIDRVTLVAMKGARVPFLSSSRYGEPVRLWSEEPRQVSSAQGGLGLDSAPGSIVPTIIGHRNNSASLSFIQSLRSTIRVRTRIKNTLRRIIQKL